MWLLPALAHAVLIFALSSHSAPVRAYPFAHADKFMHAGAFGLLAFLTAWGLHRGWSEWRLRRVLLLAFLVAVTYGASDELHQLFVPRRYTDPFDWMADCVGAFLALTLFVWWRRRATSPATSASTPPS
ncbi:MAG: VanZ family protein [Nitrospirota bacterium]|nr:VanZ family protein [Nitrospirota bacterium]